MKEVKLPYVNITYEDPIVYFIFIEGAELGFPEIRELTACAEKLSGNKPYLSFSDARVNLSVTNEGRRVAADLKNAPLVRGNAILLKNNMLKVAANFFYNFNKPLFPFRAFTDKEKAISWLLSLPLEKENC
jgi:hypothetical protein